MKLPWNIHIDFPYRQCYLTARPMIHFSQNRKLYKPCASVQRFPCAIFFFWKFLKIGNWTASTFYLTCSEKRIAHHGICLHKQIMKRPHDPWQFPALGAHDRVVQGNWEKHSYLSIPLLCYLQKASLSCPSKCLHLINCI